jgi:molecular chaperone GrpE
MPTRKHKQEAENEAKTVPNAEAEAQATETAVTENAATEAAVPEAIAARPDPELVEAQVKAQEYLDGWQRERAEFFNYKRRIEREMTQSAQNALGNAMRRYLDIADDLERALRNRPQEGDGAVWASGIELIYRKLMTAFEADGVKPIETEGAFFDPSLHEAISQEDDEKLESGQIIGAVQTGYMLGERVLRPARVRVAR